MTDPYRTTADVADRLGLSEETVRRLCRRGVIASVQIGRKHRILQSELDRIEREGINKSSVGPNILRPAEDLGAGELATEMERIGAQVAMLGADLQALAGRCKRRKTAAAALKSWGNVTLTLGLELRRQAKTMKAEAQP